jgi:hypothetical protein
MTVTGLLPDVVVRLHGPDALKVVADAVRGVSTVRLSRATAALIGVFVMRKLPINKTAFQVGYDLQWRFHHVRHYCDKSQLR